MSLAKRYTIPLHSLAWFVVLASLLTTHVSYLMAASLGHVDWCFLYGSDCYSISATGRKLPEKLWFKFGMMPAAVALMLLWWAAAAWLRQAAVTALPLTLTLMPLLGIVAALFLMLYTVALGEQGDAYRLTRRIGITLSFSLTFMAQLLFVRLLDVLSRQPGYAYVAPWRRRLLGVLLVLLATGVLSVVLDVLLGKGYDRFENGFEWTMALMLNTYFVLLALLWRRADLRITLSSPA